MTATALGAPASWSLGGGFAGIGAAQKLKKSDVDVVLVDKHDYHTFQPLLYQVATGLLEQPAVGHPIRDLVHKQANARVHQDTVTAIDLDAREVRFSELEPLTYDYLVLGLGAEVNFFGVEGAPEHAFPLYTLADAVRLEEPCPEDVGSGRSQAGADRRRRPEHRRRRRRPNRDRDRGRARGALPRRVHEGLPRRDTGAGADHARRGRAGALPDVQAGHPHVHGEGARQARRRGADRRGGGVDHADAA